jgi:hypothetical protein
MTRTENNTHRLSRHRIVLTLHAMPPEPEAIAGDASLYFGAEEEPWAHTSARLRLDDWVDMGRPTEITVTVEPGDLLNAEE